MFLDKKKLRNHYLNKRLNFDENNYKDMNNRIFTNFLKILNELDNNINIYMPIIEKKEVNIFPIIEVLCEKKFELSANITNFTTMEMKPVKYKIGDKLSINKFNILEPKEKNNYNINDIKVLLVPMIICDIYGTRIGYGKGIYDRFMSKNKDKLKIGFSFWEPLQSRIKTNNYDIPINICITPNNIFYLNN